MWSTKGPKDEGAIKILVSHISNAVKVEVLLEGGATMMPMMIVMIVMTMMTMMTMFRWRCC